MYKSNVRNADNEALLLDKKITLAKAVGTIMVTGVMCWPDLQTKKSLGMASACPSWFGDKQPEPKYTLNIDFMKRVLEWRLHEKGIGMAIQRKVDGLHDKVA
jgi:hypothetical protein